MSFVRGVQGDQKGAVERSDQSQVYNDLRIPPGAPRSCVTRRRDPGVCSLGISKKRVRILEKT